MPENVSEENGVSLYGKRGIAIRVGAVDRILISWEKWDALKETVERLRPQTRRQPAPKGGSRREGPMYGA